MRLAKQREVWPIHRKKVINRNCPRGHPRTGLTRQRLYISCFKYVQRHDIQKRKASLRTMSHLLDNSNKGTETGLSSVSEQAGSRISKLGGMAMEIVQLEGKTRKKETNE